MIRLPILLLAFGCAGPTGPGSGSENRYGHEGASEPNPYIISPEERRLHPGTPRQTRANSLTGIGTGGFSGRPWEVDGAWPVPPQGNARGKAEERS